MSQELSVIKQQVSKAVNAAQSFTVTSQEELTKGVDLLSRIKQVGKMIKERMEAPIKVAYAAYKKVKEEQERTFGEMLTSYEEAEKIVKGKMLIYQQEEDRKQKEAEAKIAARVEKGTLTLETAAKKLEAIPEVQTKVEGKKGEIQVKKIKKFEVMDKTKLPFEYLLPDEVAIRKAMFEGTELAGVRYWEEETIAAR